MLALPPLQLQDNDLRTNVFATLVTSARDSLAKHEVLYGNNRAMHKYICYALFHYTCSSPVTQ